ncbi:MAG: hypothetical protein ABIP50_03685 [Candidatus Saccharimonadales bacterium]
MDQFAIAAWVIVTLAVVLLVVFTLKAASNIHHELNLGNQRFAKHSLDLARLFAWMAFIASLIWGYIGLHAHDSEQMFYLWLIGVAIVVGGWIFSILNLKDADRVLVKQQRAERTSAPLDDR